MLSHSILHWTDDCCPISHHLINSHSKDRTPRWAGNQLTPFHGDTGLCHSRTSIAKILPIPHCPQQISIQRARLSASDMPAHQMFSYRTGKDHLWEHWPSGYQHRLRSRAKQRIFKICLLEIIFTFICSSCCLSWTCAAISLFIFSRSTLLGMCI